MSYSIKRADLIAEQLERLATQNLHQLAGQVANLAFWISEAVGAISILREYPTRFRVLRDAQVGWVKTHGTKVSGYCPICEGACELGATTPGPPRRISSEDIEAARERVRRAVRRYLLRLYRAHFLNEDAVRRACGELGVGVETEDFQRDSATMAEPPVDASPSRQEEQ